MQSSLGTNRQRNATDEALGVSVRMGWMSMVISIGPLMYRVAA
jgi:hypothetical protein